jgi:hypothetical protein
LSCQGLLDNWQKRIPFLVGKTNLKNGLEIRRRNAFEKRLRKKKNAFLFKNGRKKKNEFEKRI